MAGGTLLAAAPGAIGLAIILAVLAHVALSTEGPLAAGFARVMQEMQIGASRVRVLSGG